MANFIVTVIFIGIILKQWSYIRTIKVPVKKSIAEIALFTLGIFAFVLLTIYSTKEYIHYLIGVFGVVAFILIWIKLGITDTGVITNARGKKVFLWSEIKNVEISRKDFVKVVYFNKLGAKIFEQKYEIKKHEQIVSLLQKNNIKIRNT
ncbi:MAG: hypothetical protein RBR71_07660 [Gudongella sp.]|nr:hypothetical protein [Gudongella sp.]